MAYQLQFFFDPFPLLLFDFFSPESFASLSYPLNAFLMARPSPARAIGRYIYIDSGSSKRKCTIQRNK